MNLFSKFLGKGKKASGDASNRVSGFLSALESDLGIDATQRSGIEQALREFMQGKKAAKQSGDKSALQDERDEFRDAINQILNPEQQQKFAAKFQEYKHLLKG